MSTITKVLQVVGLLTVATTTLKVLTAIRVFLASSKSLDRYQRGNDSYALVTGASDGIGFGLARGLAARGFNLILVARNKEKLENRKSGLLKEYPNVKVEILVVNAFSKSLAEDLEKALSTVAHLKITILINNLGGLPAIKYPHYRTLGDWTTDELDQVIALNSRNMIYTTRKMIPVLSKNGPSLILNISSGAQVGIPRLVPYSATKGFVQKLTFGLRREFITENIRIDVLNIVLGDVNSKSNMTAISLNAPSSTDFANATLNRVNGALSAGWLEVNPYIPHALGNVFLDVMPEFVTRNALFAAIKEKRRLDDIWQKEGKYD